MTYVYLLSSITFFWCNSVDVLRILYWLWALKQTEQYIVCCGQWNRLNTSSWAVDHCHWDCAHHRTTSSLSLFLDHHPQHNCNLFTLHKWTKRIHTILRSIHTKTITNTGKAIMEPDFKNPRTYLSSFSWSVAVCGEVFITSFIKAPCS